MASPIVTGPVHIYVGTPPVKVAAAAAAAAGAAFVGGPTAAVPILSLAQLLSRTPQYLGTGKVGPNVRKRRHYAPVMNDSAGPMLPFDKIRAGQDAIVSVTLTRFNPPVYRQVASMSNTSGLPGIETAADRGTLMITEGQAYPLFLRFPYYDSHGAMKGAGMVPGYRFYAAMLEGDDDEQTGSQAQELTLTWYCGGVYDRKTNGWGLYDHTLTGVPALAPN